MVHPEHGTTRVCTLDVGARGLALRSTRRDGRAGRVVLDLPWWRIVGMAADGTAHAPDGRLLQQLDVRTEIGNLTMLCAAPAVGILLHEIGARSRRWRLERLAPVRLLAAASASTRGVARRLGRLATPRGLRRLSIPERLVPLSTAAGRLPHLARERLLGPAEPSARRRARGALALGAVCTVWLVTVVCGVGLPGDSPSVAASKSQQPAAQRSGPGLDATGMAQILETARFQAGVASHLAPATAPPPPALPSVADGAPLAPHEVFGFAPYWTLADEQTFDVSGYSTIAYFAIGVNANGTLDEQGTGWDGYESQDFADLVARAHAAGDRVVLTVNCFSQHDLDTLTSSPTAAATLATEVVAAIAAKNLDGVNIDFEGEGSSDQAGLTSLVSTVSSAVHLADPHYQVTMDTYASSAGDPDGFYDIPALAPLVDGFFVMAYEFNLSSQATSASPITSVEFSDTLAAAQYAAAVAPTKVILGTSYFGYTWATTDGTMAAEATGTAVAVGDGQIAASGEPVYWDPVTDTAWTSYEVGDQWYETYFQSPQSLYLIAQLAQTYGLAGVGAWALGMDADDAQMAGALDGQPPGGVSDVAGPTSTTPSGAGAGAGPLLAPVAVAGAGASASAAAAANGTVSAPPAPSASASTSTTPAAVTGDLTSTYATTARWETTTVTLTYQSVTVHPSGEGGFVGMVTDVTTTDPALECLVKTTNPLEVWRYADADSYIVLARTPTNCVDARFTFPVPAGT